MWLLRAKERDDQNTGVRCHATCVFLPTMLYTCCFFVGIAGRVASATNPVARVIPSVSRLTSRNNSGDSDDSDDSDGSRKKRRKGNACGFGSSSCERSAGISLGTRFRPRESHDVPHLPPTLLRGSYQVSHVLLQVQGDAGARAPRLREEMDARVRQHALSAVRAQIPPPAASAPSNPTGTVCPLSVSYLAAPNVLEQPRRTSQTPHKPDSSTDRFSLKKMI